MFNRCPKECDYVVSLDNLEADQDQKDVPIEPQMPLQPGERLFAFNIDAYLNRHMEVKETEHILNQKDPVFEERVTVHYHEYKDVFDKKDFDELPERHIWDHAVELMLDFKPIDCKVYPLSLKEEPVLRELIKENLRTGRIQPSKSLNASPFFFIQKPDRSGLHPTQDY